MSGSVFIFLYISLLKKLLLECNSSCENLYPAPRRFPAPCYFNFRRTPDLLSFWSPRNSESKEKNINQTRFSHRSLGRLDKRCLRYFRGSQRQLPHCRYHRNLHNTDRPVLAQMGGCEFQRDASGNSTAQLQ